MADDHDPAVANAPALPPRKRRALRWLVGTALALLVVFGGGYALLDSQMALEFAMRRAIAAADGHLTIEGAQGSLLSTIRVERIAWRGDDLDVTAEQLLMTWSPTDLLSRRFNVQGLGAKRIAFDYKASSANADPATGGGGLPDDLGLPLEIAVRNVGVERLEWRAGKNAGVIAGIAFDYFGGAGEHALRALRLVAPEGALAGEVTLGARAPHAVQANVEVEGDGDLRGATATVTATGVVERLELAAKGAYRDAAISARALVTPFAASPLVSADVDARKVDIARFKKDLPTTDLTLTLVARPQGQGFVGTLEARNEAIGPIDQGHVPVANLSASYAWEGATLKLDDLMARLAGDGRVTGSATLPFDGRPSQWNVRLVNVNLAVLQSTLIATRLSGSVVAEVAESRQVVRADLRQEDMSLEVAATVAGSQVIVERFRAQAGAGVLTGKGEASLDDRRAFNLDVRANAFDPGRFADVPHGRLDGTLKANGTLKPDLDVTAAIALSRGSRVADQPVSGSARAHVIAPAGKVDQASARDVAVDMKFGTATLVANGAVGRPADRLTYTLDVPRLEDWRATITRFAKASLPVPLSGSIHAQGAVSGDPRDPGFTVDAQAKAFKWGPDLSAQAISINGSIAAGADGKGRVALAARPLKITATANGLDTKAVSVRALRFGIEGTLARHSATLTAQGKDFDLDATVAGGLREPRQTDGATDFAWAGTVEKLVNRGEFAVRLEAPATIEVARQHVRVGNARVAVADGKAELVSFAFDDGKLDTRGTFTGIPVASLARLAGQKVPLKSTLVIGGDWSLAGTEALNGTINVKREQGDLFATESETANSAHLAFGISELALAARWNEGALEASAKLRSSLAGNADAKATVAAGSAPLSIATDGPLTASITADLASLRPLQPFLGTVAVVDGRAHLDIKATGTLAQPELAGTMTGDALRLDLPQYGVHMKDGRLRARLAERAIELDEFSFGGGAGRFTAHGTIARAANATDRANATAKVTWEATDFALVNRPDLRLVADGKGTLALVEGKLELAGDIRFDEGRILFEPVTAGTLSSDVVIVGQPRPAAKDDDMTRNLPLRLDLQVALGRDFRFSGEGLDTRLAGRVRITTTPDGTLASKGTINAVAGTYYVFGQRLEITRGRLIFDGPVDNPALDVVAMRRNIAVESGVEVTGTVRVPRVRLVSNPPVPDGEKLAWLITGRGVDRANGAEMAALAAASSALLGQGHKPITTQIANTFGLDDISIRDSGSGGSAGGAQVVAFGKRLSDRLSLAFEQGLGAATSALRLEYALSRTLTLRAEAGTVSSLGFFFRRSFD